MGIEPTYSAWEADVLPLNYTRVPAKFYSGLPYHRPMIEVTVNGKAQRLEQSVRISGLLETLELSGKKVAVERNGEIVPRSAHATTLLADGDQLEIVVAVGGG